MSQMELCRARIGRSGSLTASAQDVWIEGATDASAEQRDLWLNGAGSGLREYARGHAVLHGSAVSYGAVGVSIVGSTRMGKSSLAAWLCQREWSFISDAMTVVHPKTLILLPQANRLRLYDDSLRALGEMKPASVPYDDEISGKRRWAVEPDKLAAPETKLCQVVVLERGERVSLHPLAGSAASIMLVRHAYLARSLDPGESARLLSLAAMLIAGGVRVNLVRIPKNWHAMGDAKAAIEASLDRR